MASVAGRRRATGEQRWAANGCRGDTGECEEEIEDPVDRLLSRDPKLVRLNALIRRHQRELRNLCSEEAWQQYLRIEELTTEHAFSLADLLLKQSR
jgi:hypothetical protein